MAVEPVECALRRRRCTVACAFVGVQLDVGQAAVVIDDRVRERHSRRAVASSASAAVCAANGRRWRDARAARTRRVRALSMCNRSPGTATRSPAGLSRRRRLAARTAGVVCSVRQTSRRDRSGSPTSAVLAGRTPTPRPLILRLLLAGHRGSEPRSRSSGRAADTPSRPLAPRRQSPSSRSAPLRPHHRRHAATAAADLQPTSRARSPTHAARPRQPAT